MSDELDARTKTMLTSDLAGFRLSPQQEHLWRAQGSGPSRGFVCQALLELRGPLDRNRLRRILERIVERHEILRTAFRRLPGMSLPIQVIQDRGEVLWNELEASGQDVIELDRFLAEARRSPLRLEDGAVLQASLVSLGEERHTLLLTLPALVVDALSLRVLAHEIAALYSGQEGAGGLPDPLQYADVADTMQEWLGPEDGPGAAFWRQQGAPSLQPTDTAEPAVPETVHRLLPADPVAELASTAEVSIPLLLLAAWSAALWWETGEGRRTIAVSHDGRTFDELSQAVGPYACYLPLPSVAGPGITLGELAQDLEEALDAAAAWRDAFSLDRLGAGTAGQGSVPLWPFGFDSDRTAVLSPTLSLRPAFVGLGRFGLRLSVLEEDTEIRLDLHYDPSLHDRGHAERLLVRLERVLAGAAAGREVPLGEIDVLGEAERRELLVGFNDTTAPYPAGITVCDLFEEQVRLAPQAPAVAAGEVSLTFSELDARANRLARHLRALGIGPESRVGIHLEREPEMVVALLAVLKAGAAYVPFDPGHPAERLRFLLQDAGLAALVTRERLRPPGADTILTIRVDPGGTDAEAVSRQSATPPPQLAGPGNAAYVIYTSGSTGLPKGVLVTHRGLFNYLYWARSAYGTGLERGAPVHSPLGFDLTVTSLFVPLLTGAAITLLPEEDGIGALAEALRTPGGKKEGAFGLAKITPAHLGLLRQLTADGEPPPSAACLVIGGDALWDADIAPWRRRGTRIFNEYGPTETVVGCCVHEVDPERPDAGAVPIGRPIANTRLYVLGPGLRPVPAGVPGELWIGGDGVARGYLGRPGLTAERFVPDPFAPPDRAGDRVYRTGDLVRLVSPGPVLEFLGRIDDQIKIRGHRIEPNEVAAALAAHPALRDAAVGLHGAGDDRRLVSWIVPRDRARRPTAAELRGFLAERLPEPMIPAAFVHVDVLPLTPNGKLDRRALPDPDLQRDDETPYVAPRTFSEEILAEIWGHVLGVDRVGIDDHFFTLGGDSIRSLQVLSLAQKRGLAVTLQDLFQWPTVRKLAESVKLHGAAPAEEPDLPPFALISSEDRRRLAPGIEDAYPVSQVQMGMLFHTERDRETAVYHVQHSFHMQGRLDPELMQSAIDRLVERHSILRTSFDLARFSEPLQLVHAGVKLPLGVDDLSALEPEARKEAVLAWLTESRHHPFDWTRPPLVRFHVHLLGENEFQLTLSLHHAVLDGWSVAVMLAELFHVYMAQLQGVPREEPPLTTSFREFVSIERSLLGSPVAAEFWDRYLDGAELTTLPRGGGSRAGASGVGIITDLLSQEVSDGLRQLARTAVVPLKSVLLSAHLRALSLLSGRTDISTGLVSHSRPERQDGERVLGMFLNTVPVRLRLAGGTWLELAQATFDAELALLPFRAFPLPELQRRQGGRPLFETVLNFLHYHAYQSVIEIPGLAAQGSTGYEEINYPFMATFALSPAPGTPQVRLQLNHHKAELGDEEAQGIYRRYHAILEAMVADPASRYDVSLLSAAEQHQILVEWNDHEVAGPGPCLHQLFEALAMRCGDSVAISAGEESLTYGELHRRASGLAQHLRTLGIGPEARVALCLERTPDLVWAVLGVLAAGGAYLPLDPSYPRERLSFVLEDSKSALLLTERHLAGVLPEGGPPRIWLDELRGELASAPAGFPADVTDSQNLAYVIYTSGSTGRPKGVQVPHSALTNFLASVAKIPGLASSDVLLAVTTLSFDIAALEIFLPLVAGARIELAPRDAVGDGERLAALLQSGITTMQATPATWRMLLDAGWVGSPDLKLLVGGEALPRNLADRLLGASGSLWNMYGPTETTIWSALERITPGPELIAIGRPLDNTRIYLLSSTHEPLPVGVPGELCIGGRGVARGYLGRPDLTAERFIPSLHDERGARLYRTGDLARYLPDGRIEFLGRIDHQVKIRGFRVELGEIEFALSGLAGVREAVVVAHENRPAELAGRRLVAYVVGDVTAEALRTSLRERLPDYMMPSAFVTLTALPLTPNGKVDRKALPAPEWQSAEAGYLAPRTPVEEVLASIWAEVLGLERVGAADHFFDLGGHSLLATRVMSRLRSACGVELPLRDLFEVPRLADLAARVEVTLRSGAGRLSPPVVPTAQTMRGGGLPLSFAQQRLWFIDQLEPGSPLYNMPLAMRVEGPLDCAVLALCFGEITRRHETLRTVFTVRNGSPVQMIQPAVPFELPVVDLSGLPKSVGEALALSLSREEAGRPFDLAGGPMLRGVLWRLAEEDHAVVLTMHHIASDGWSRGILIREAAALYAAWTEGRTSPLAELPVQYADFAAWQRSWLQGGVLESEMSFWRRQLAGLPPLLELPTDRPRPAVQSFRGASRPLRLPVELIRRAQALSRREGATLFMVLMAGFQALLSRYSGQQDLAVGSPVAGRNRVEIEGLIGFFVNTLVLRGDLSGEPSFYELLGRIRETALAAYLYQDVPFEKLVEELAPERSLAQTPLVQVMLVLQNAPMGRLEASHLRLHPLDTAVTTSKFDLTVSLTEQNGELNGTAEHASDLFDGTTIDRLTGHFERFLAAALEAPERRAAELSLLSEAERGQILVEWNDAGPSAAPHANVHELFAAQARRTPDAAAVIFGNTELTYADLASRAGRLARHLRRLGVGPDVLVGLLVERSLDMIVGVLGILQAGGAYVPLDPGYPEQRLAFMLDDTRAPVVLTQEPLRGRVPAGRSEVVLLDGGEITAVKAANIGVPAAGEPSGASLAYVIYTSGSTGRPKGVALSHGALRNLIDWHLATLLGGVRTLQFASVSFDASFHEMFACWGSGGTLVVVAEELRRDMPALATLLVEQRIEKAILPVVVLTQLAETFAGREELPPLREITTTGERLQTNQVMAALLKRLPGCAFHNHYGPSETHVATAFTLRPDPGDWAIYPSVGRPIWSSSAYVLEPGLVPAPIGVPGDLYLGGACVARGYLGRPGLTAERFVPDPFGDMPGGRLYRTGDKVRLAVGGELEYLGRFDEQVKIRGFRIEPGEIEEALLALPGVREAVVLAREDRPAAGSSGRRLVAYVVGDAPASALRDALRDRLPDYMVPASFVTLAALPLTPNGKVDKKALPAPEWQHPEEGWLAPRTPVEEILAGIWAEVLGLERVGAADHFFERGGHSLLATRVTSRLRAAFGVEIPLRALFEAPVLSDLAARVEAARKTGADRPAPPLVPVPREGALPLSFAQQRLWFIDQLEPGSSLYNTPVSLRVAGPLDCGVLAASLGEIVRRHEALRTVFAAPEGSPVQVVQPAAPFMLPVVDLSELAEKEREALAISLAGEEARRPFDLSRGPLLYGVLLRLVEDDHVVVLTMHHVASDGWSMSILVREIMALYPAFAEGRPSPLPELPVQYADFAAWQRSWLQGEVLENEIAFWRRQLAGLPPLLELPTDRPRPAVQSFRGALRPVRLPEGLTRQAQSLSRLEGVTLFMVLLAGFQALLARYSGQEDLAVGTPVAGRNRLEIEGLIGFFINTLVLRGDLTGEPSFRELLGRVRETAFAAYLHQDLPFEKLVEELAPERSLAHPPLFQVMFVLQNAPTEMLEVRDLSLRPFSGARTTAKFELAITLAQHGGEISGAIEYSTDLFDRTTIDRMAGHFESLLATATASAERPASHLPLLTEAECHQLRTEWNDTVAPARPGVVELFEAQARRSPGAVAVALAGDAGPALTYGDLDRRADLLAGRLRALGAGPGMPVGLCVDQSPDLVVAILGIFKSGGALLALDPAHPPARLAFLLEDAAASVLVTRSHLLAGLPLHGARTVLLDAEEIIEEGRARGDGPGPQDLAYLIYTSGTTGQPKAVLVEHGMLAATLAATRGLFRFTAEDRMPCLALSTFDISLFELLSPLLAGGTAVLFPLRPTLDVEHLVDHLGELTCLHAVPALMQGILESLRRRGAAAPDLGPDLGRMRSVFVGGDAVPAELLQDLRETFPAAQVWVLYGPTEGTILSSAHPVPPPPAPAQPLLGRPLAGVVLDIRDAKGELLPVGVPGELWIGGTGVTRGYLGRAELTAEKYVLRGGERFYRSGDRVRRLADGTLEFLGRLDQQVKVRGFRVELGEVEAALAALTGVREAVVVAREDTPADRRLVAYVVGDAAPDVLRQSLRERLPDYMVPADLVMLTTLPLTPHGKVDRKSLPAPSWQRPGESYQAPRTPVEEVLAGIWAELLGLDRVGTADHFFDLGGHSLLAMRVMSRLRTAFGVEMPLRSLFEAPTLAALAARVEAARRAGAEQLAPPLVPMLREGPPPLSFAQQRLWFIDQLEPGTSLYNIPVVLRIEGPLQHAVLALCLGEIAHRHEALRTVFAAPEGTPAQVIQPAAPFVVPVVDLSGLPESRREALALGLAGEEGARPFDLACGPLLRGMLLRLAEADHAVALTLHHIVSDGWSMGVLVREVSALYRAFAAGRPSPLPELPVQYADFAIWQHSWLRGEVLEGEIAYWRRQLADLPPLLNLPTDRPRPAVQSFRGAARPVRLPAGLTQQITALSRREGATLFMVLLAGFQALLARYGGQQDLAVGTPVSGRNRMELEGLIGFFVNTLVLRCDLAGEPSFLELLSRVRETALTAHTHQDVPFEKLVEELAPERSLAQTPLFQVMFVLQNAPSESLEIPGLRLRPVSRAGTAAKFDLELGLQEHGGTLTGTVEHASDLFDASTIDRLVLHYERLLAAALAQPELRVSELQLLSPMERHQLLSEWNDTALPFSRGPLLSSLFAAQVARRPHALAATFGDESLTYAQLGAAAERLARHLCKLGCGPESRVGVALERTLDLLVAFLGVLEAGAVYVPLDPEYPRERLAYQMEDSRLAVLLTQESLKDRLPLPGSVPVLMTSARSMMDDTIDPATPEDLGDHLLAYTIYTSGSTGRPKGVMVTQAGMINHLHAKIADLGLGEDSRVAQTASQCFDISVWQLLAPLLAGGSVHIADEPTVHDPELLLRFVARRQITVLEVVPSLLSGILESLTAARGKIDLSSLQWMIPTGEACPQALADRWLELAPHTRLLNAYGPTECSDDVTHYEMPRIGAGPSLVLPIGRPVANTQIYVVDPAGQPVASGIPGELCVGGRGVGRGYFGLPERTAQVFVPNAWSEEPGSRLYRTGDLARRMADGTLEFLGRLDHQVKVRGFRIELGEIEAVLVKLAGIREAAVLARNDTPGGQRLVAYVAGDLTVDALRKSLRERLPEHMVPAAFVTLAALPLTPSGKVDRKALPAPEGQSTDETCLPPRTPTEEILAGIWAELLGLERVGANDHFFDLGGHSLLATRALSRLRAAFDIEMPLRDLFEAPVLADLAARIEDVRRAGAGQITPPLVPVPRDRPLPLSFAQQRLWFLHQLDPLSPAYNMPFSFRLSGPLSVPALAASLTEVVRRHETLRTTLVLTGDEPVQSIASPSRQPLHILDLAALPAAARETLALRLGEEETARPFDLARPPVLRTLLLRLSGDDHILLFTIHHVSGDGWSAEVLARELVELYEAAVAGRAARLPALPVQYADFAVWQRSWLQGEVLEAQIEYWRRQLSGAPPLLELPLDRPRPPVQSSRGGRRRLRLPAEPAAALAALGRREGATGFMTLLAGFQALLHRYSGQESVVVGTPIANRERREVEGLIGFFANTLALRADFAGAPGFADLLAQVREASLGAYEHQDLPFEKLVDELAPRRDMSYAAVFQVLFVYQNVPRQVPHLRELSLLPIEIDAGVARFDLTLACAETGAGLAMNLDYNADLFEAATADRMLRLFVHLLAQIAAEPRRPVADLPLLDDVEHRQVVLACNATDCARPGEDLSLHGLFARQAGRTPEAPAVVAEDGVIRYGELAGWAGRIADQLRYLGIGAEDRVGVCLERSGGALAALLGALAAGAAYVPLDPEWPRERLAAVAADAGLVALLTRSGLTAGAGLAPFEVLVDEARHGAPVDVPWSPPASPEAAAYVIYTSGSTGAAKGVVIPHRAAANFVLALDEVLELAPADRLLLFAPLSFDASVLQIFLPLARGAAVVVHADPRELAGGELPGFCERHGVTVLDLPAALWRQWIEDMATEGRTLPAGIRTFLTGGESVPAERVRVWAGMARRPAAFLSSYGPTEATVTATVFLTDSGAAATLLPGKVPIGSPLANVRAYVLDARMHPVPAGVTGELYLAGGGLARGYLDRPELTAASFLPDAVSGAHGGRLYRTGDLARRLPGGDLEFLGRADTQVKIRGFRLELSEVETVLGRHPALAECVVTVREDRPGDRRLVAYAVPQPGAAPGVSELRAYVAERLPQYMVPAAFVLLDTLQVLASGKVDRAALPDPESDRPELGSTYSDPVTATEEALATLWAQVLRLDRVGIHDNFFELGGDSILSIQILARANQMGMRLTARQIFEYPTVAELARVAASAPLIAAEQGLVTGEVPMTPIQRWFFAEDFPAAHHFNQAMVLDVVAQLSPAILERAVAAIAGHHDALRMRFPRQDGLPRQENAGAEGAVPLLWIDLSALPAGSLDAARTAAQNAVQVSFDLEHGPLARLAAFDAGAHGRRILWVAHHLVVDGISWRVLIEDLETACRLVAEGRPPVLPAKTTSFRAWAERLVGHVRSGGFQSELPYWIGVVEREAVRLPVDFPEGWAANTVESGLIVSMTLSPEDTQTLLQVVPSTYRTQINDALLAALVRAFASWTGSPALVVDLEAHGREPLFDDVDLSRTVGWFTTHFPVRLDIEGASGAVGALLAVQEQLRQVPGRGIGYALLLHEGGPEAAPLRAAPPVQVSFNYLGQFDSSPAEAAFFRLTDEPAGATRHRRAHRTHLIEVGGQVAGGQLHFGFGYSANLHRRETIERLGALFEAALRDLINQCRTGEEVAPTPSDFHLVKLDEKSFQKLAALFDDEE